MFCAVCANKIAGLIWSFVGIPAILIVGLLAFCWVAGIDPRDL